MKFLFRADASVQIGSGHVMRCITLAHELKRKGHQCVFVCREHRGHLGEHIVREGFELRLLPEPASVDDISLGDYASWLGVSWQVDADETLEIAKSYRPDWLVVDHYALDLKWEVTLRDFVGQTMVIDDLANRPHECALLLDQNLGRMASDYDGLLPAECQRMIGPRYALLRPEFAALREQSLKRRQSPELKRILISLGGVDRTNVTGQILTVLASSSLPASTELDIIMGASAPYLNEVCQQVAELPFTATVNVNVQDMAERMSLADLSIGAAGSTSWERCCMGLPSVTVIIAENQRGIAESLAKYKAGLSVDTQQVAEQLTCLIETYAGDVEMRQLISQNAAQVCDGIGANRVVSVFMGEVV